MRPNSIRWFDRLVLTSLILGIVGMALNYAAAQAQIASNPVTAKWGNGFLIGSMVGGLGYLALMWYLIARRANNVAKWIWVVFFVLGSLYMPASFRILAQTDQGTIKLALALINSALQLAATVMLFRPDARVWFANRGKGIDPDIFR